MVGSSKTFRSFSDGLYLTARKSEEKLEFGKRKAKGIKTIEGAVVGDASIFEDNMTPTQWIWGDMGNYFGAGACGLTSRGGGKSPRSTRVRISPLSFPEKGGWPVSKQYSVAPRL